MLGSNLQYIQGNLDIIYVPIKVIQERRKERKTGVVKEKKDLLDLLMDMYDEETDSKMDDEELRAQVLYFVCKTFITEER